MSKTKFNKLHTNNITINGTKYRVLQSINGTKYRVLQSKNSRSCLLCDCKLSHDCISSISLHNCCTDTIGPYGYLKRINHGKN